MKRNKKNSKNSKPHHNHLPKTERTDTQPSFKDKGIKAFTAKRFEKAVDHFTKAIEKKEDNIHTIYSNRAAAYYRLGKFYESLRDSDMCINIKPDWPKGYYRRGVALEKLLRYPEAYASYKEGLEVDNNEPNLVAASKELSLLLSELKISEDDLHSSDTPDSDKFSRLVYWLKEGGCRFPKLYLQYYSESYRGVHCLAKIKTDECVLFVPLKYIITSAVAQASEIGKEIKASGVQLRSRQTYVASYLLQERENSSSFWKPYLDILPFSFENMPVCFGEDMLNLLKGSYCLEKIASNTDSFRREYNKIRSAFPAYAKYSFDQFVWSRLAVMTRIFGITVDKKKTDGLVPYADMLNHKRPIETRWCFDERQYGFIITATKPLSRGDQIFDSYGRKSNTRFLLNYGFALDENDANECVIRVQLDKSDSLYELKLNFLGGKERNGKREYEIPIQFRDEKVKSFFSFLRFVNTNDKELFVLSDDKQDVDDLDPISIKNELKALKTLKNCAVKQLNGYGTSLEEDLQLLKDEKEYPMFSVKRNCVVQRKGEKEILSRFRDLSDQFTEYLNMEWKDLKKFVTKRSIENTEKDDTVEQYLMHVIVPLVQGTHNINNAEETSEIKEKLKQKVEDKKNQKNYYF